MRKILFLDHDGVICLPDNWGSRFKKNAKFDDFDKKAIKVLNQIIDETNCEIVVSSDWRYKATLDQLQELYTERGIKTSPISVTYMPNLPPSSLLERQRAGEIDMWVTENLTDGDSWVVVDDLDMRYFLKDNFVWTPRYLEGIKQTGIKEKIIKILNR
jgi:hypothetical protein